MDFTPSNSREFRVKFTWISLLLLNSRENFHVKFTCGDFACIQICYIPNLVKTGPVVLKDDARRTPHDDGRQTIAIGHLNESSDLQIFAICGDNFSFDTK